jgi:hypothetical protein
MHKQTRRVTGMVTGAASAACTRSSRGRRKTRQKHRAAPGPCGDVSTAKAGPTWSRRQSVCAQVTRRIRA